MTYTELKDQTAAQLLVSLKEKKLLLFTLRQKLKTMQLNNPNELGEVKRDIARINTALSALRNKDGI